MYIGLDLGTSGLKGLVIDERHRSPDGRRFAASAAAAGAVAVAGEGERPADLDPPDPGVERPGRRLDGHLQRRGKAVQHNGVG